MGSCNCSQNTGYRPDVLTAYQPETLHDSLWLMWAVSSPSLKSMMVSFSYFVSFAILIHHAAVSDAITIPPHSGGYFSFGHSPNTTSGAQVRVICLPACAYYLPPLKGSWGSNILSWSVSLSRFSCSAMYSFIAFVFFPTVST